MLFPRRLIRILWRCLSTAQPLRSPATPASTDFRILDDQVVRFLKRHSILHRVVNQKANLRVCPFCPPRKDSPDNLYKLYIWLSNGRCFCHCCGSSCSWNGFQTQIGAIPSVSKVARERIGTLPSVPDSGEQTDTTVPAPVVAELDQKKAAQSRAKLDTDTVAREFLKKKGLSFEVIKKYGVGAVDAPFLQPSGNWEKETCVTFPWARMEEDTGNGPIYVDRMKIRSVTSKWNQWSLPAGGGWGLFGWHTIPMSADDLIVVTEGEFDAMAVHQATGLHAVSLPNGAASLPIEVIPCLERFKRIVLWMDDDTAGQDGAEKFVRKLGLGRCRIVRSKRGKADVPKDANDALLRGFNLGELINEAQSSNRATSPIRQFTPQFHIIDRFHYRLDSNTLRSDCRELDDMYVLSLDVAGVHNNDINAVILDGNVSITVDFKTEMNGMSKGAKMADQRWLWCNRRCGKITYQMKLPALVNQKAITMNDNKRGSLIVKLPKCNIVKL